DVCSSDLVTLWCIFSLCLPLLDVGIDSLQEYLEIHLQKSFIRLVVFCLKECWPKKPRHKVLRAGIDIKSIRIQKRGPSRRSSIMNGTGKRFTLILCAENSFESKRQTRGRPRPVIGTSEVLLPGISPSRP